MTSRHSSSRTRRNPAARKVVVSGAVALGIVVVLALLVAGVSKLTGGFGGCGGSTRVTVAAETSIEPEVRELVDRAGDSGCASYSVTAVTSAEMEGKVAAHQELPDIWVPDSVVRLEQVSQDVQVPFTTVLNSIASTPVVIASKNSDVDLSTWTGAMSSKGLKMGDPTSSGSADAPILAGTSEVESLKTTKEALGAAMAALAQSQSGRSGPAPDEVRLLETVAATGGSAIVTEQQGVAQLARTPDAGYALAAPRTGAVFLTYPLAVTGQDSARRGDVEKAAGALRDAATGQEFADKLHRDGFRGANRTPLDAGRGVGDVTPLVVRDPDQLRTALQRWRVLSLPSRSLVLVDTSGSMGTTAGSTGKTRMQVLCETMAVGTSQFPNNAALGVWAFHSSDDPAAKPYQELTPVAALDSTDGSGTHRQAIGAAVAKLPGLVGGGTDLYTSVLDAYKTAQAGYDPQMVNSVIVLSDGANDAVSSMTREDFMSRLKQMMDPARPVIIVTVGIMEDADPTVLADIARATGGNSHIARTPGEITKVFAEAIRQRGTS